MEHFTPSLDLDPNSSAKPCPYLSGLDHAKPWQYHAQLLALRFESKTDPNSSLSLCALAPHLHLGAV